MWTCPECGAINYNKGQCECCGYPNKRSAIQDASGTGEPLPPPPILIS